MPPVSADKRFLRTKQAAFYLGLSVRSLQRLRHQPDGPPYHLFGNNIVYARDDLDAWAKNHRVAKGDPQPDVTASKTQRKPREQRRRPP